jgi:hypothetical protein
MHIKPHPDRSRDKMSINFANYLMLQQIILWYCFSQSYERFPSHTSSPEDPKIFVSKTKKRTLTPGKEREEASHHKK